MPDMQITFIQKLKIKTLFLGQEICPLFSLGCTLTPSTMFLWSFHFSLILSNLIVMCLSFLGVCVYLCCLEFTEILRYVDLEYSLNLKLFLLLFFPKVSVSLFSPQGLPLFICKRLDIVLLVMEAFSFLVNYFFLITML